MATEPGTGDSTLVRPLAMLGMLGGALFPVTYVGVGAIVPEGGTYATQMSFSGVAALPVLLWLAGTVAVYLHHRDTFGWLGRLGAAGFLVLASLSVANSAAMLFTGSALLEGSLGFALVVGEGLAALVLGVAIARARSLPRAVGGGLLLALGLLVPFGLLFVLGAVLGVTVPPLLAFALFTVPFGLGWLVVCYDIAFVAEGPDPVAATAGD